MCWWYFHIIILFGFGIIAFGMVIRTPDLGDPYPLIRTP